MSSEKNQRHEAPKVPLIRLKKNGFPWSKEIRYYVENCKIYKSHIKFDRTLNVDQSVGGKGSLNDLIRLIITNPALLQKKEAKALYEKSSGKHGEVSDAKNITAKFKKIIDEHVPTGYEFHKIGFFLMPAIPTKEALYGNIEIIYKKQVNSSSPLYYPGTKNKVNRKFVINLHIQPVRTINFTESLEVRLINIFSDFKKTLSSEGILRALEELSLEKLKCPPVGAFSIHEDSVLKYKHYANKKKQLQIKAIDDAAVEPLSSVEENAHEDEKRDLKTEQTESLPASQTEKPALLASFARFTSSDKSLPAEEKNQGLLRAARQLLEDLGAQNFELYASCAERIEKYEKLDRVLNYEEFLDLQGIRNDLQQALAELAQANIPNNQFN